MEEAMDPAATPAAVKPASPTTAGIATVAVPTPSAAPSAIPRRPMVLRRVLV
uniref:Uncharacterized protein n=1 Tax=Anguilla anguilla TaxID=7936 RepID=A0A0E9V6J7_ANGAN